MKINECTLAAFSTSHYDAPPDKEGWLWKKGEVNKVSMNTLCLFIRCLTLFL